MIDGNELRKLVEAETGGNLFVRSNEKCRALFVLLAHDYFKSASYKKIAQYLKTSEKSVYALATQGYKLAEQGDKSYLTLVAQIEQQGGVKCSKKVRYEKVVDRALIERVLKGRKMLYNELINAVYEGTGRGWTYCRKSLKPCFASNGGFIERDADGRFYLPASQNDKK